VHFFGVWENPQAALQNYHAVAADLHAGRQPSVNVAQDAATVKDVCNHYLTFQHQKVLASHIKASSFDDCSSILRRFAKFVDGTRIVSNLVSDDFQRFSHAVTTKKLSGKRGGLGVYALSRAITIIRAMFNHAYKADLIDKPMKYGAAFDKPSAVLKRKSRRASDLADGKKFFEPATVRMIVNAAESPLRAMILLGLNGGFGNTDCAQLSTSAIDMESGLIDFPRPKTGVERVVPLWPETQDALRKALANRPASASKDLVGLTFLTTFGRP
jgi:integrase